jgi:hypothetical protein
MCHHFTNQSNNKDEANLFLSNSIQNETKVAIFTFIIQRKTPT